MMLATRFSSNWNHLPPKEELSSRGRILLTARKRGDADSCSINLLRPEIVDANMYVVGIHARSKNPALLEFKKKTATNPRTIKAQARATRNGLFMAGDSDTGCTSRSNSSPGYPVKPAAKALVPGADMTARKGGFHCRKVYMTFALIRTLHRSSFGVEYLDHPHAPGHALCALSGEE